MQIGERMKLNWPTFEKTHCIDNIYIVKLKDTNYRIKGGTLYRRFFQYRRKNLCNFTIFSFIRTSAIYPFITLCLECVAR